MSVCDVYDSDSGLLVCQSHIENRGQLSFHNTTWTCVPIRPSSIMYAVIETLLGVWLSSYFCLHLLLATCHISITKYVQEWLDTCEDPGGAPPPPTKKAENKGEYQSCSWSKWVSTWCALLVYHVALSKILVPPLWSITHLHHPHCIMLHKAQNLFRIPNCDALEGFCYSWFAVCLY